MAICWERADPLAFHLYCFFFSAVFKLYVSLSHFEFGAECAIRLHRFLIIAFLFTLYMRLTFDTGELAKVSAGRGCPRNWTKCTKYCISERYASGFCVRAMCCCLPNIFTADQLDRFVHVAMYR